MAKVPDPKRPQPVPDLARKIERCVLRTEEIRNGKN
jgi:hypothetical protein